jgi:hypothetical protein
MKWRHDWRIITSVFLLCQGWPVGAWARDDRIPGSRFITARAAGMGDQFIASADDATALFYNPAGLAKIKRFNLETLTQFGINMAFVKTLTLNSYKFFSLPLYQPVLANNVGLSPGVSGAVFPNVSFRGFAAGVLYQNRVTAKDRGDGTIRNRSRFELIPTAGVSIPLYSGIFKLGYSVQYLNVAKGNVLIDTATDAVGYNEKLYEGTALSHTAGFTFTVPAAYLPSVHVVARNVNNTVYTSSALLPLAKNSSGAPATEPMTVDAAFGLTPKAGGGTSVSVNFQGRDILNPEFITNVLSFTNLLNLKCFELIGSSVEVNIRDRVFLRGGFGSGSPSAGIGFRGGRSELNIGWWSEDVGDDYHDEKDMRFTIQYTMRTF